jgi:hypothetical protein
LGKAHSVIFDCRHVQLSDLKSRVHGPVGISAAMTNKIDAFANHENLSRKLTSIESMSITLPSLSFAPKKTLRGDETGKHICLQVVFLTPHLIISDISGGDDEKLLLEARTK